MRSVQTDASTHDQSRDRPPASAPCLALSGTADAPPCGIRPSRLHLPASLPSTRFCCPDLSRLTPHRYYEGSDSCPPRPAGRSLRLLRFAFRTSRPQPRRAPERRFPSHLSASVGPHQGPGFAMRSQARRHRPPNRVRHPTGYPFASGCSPPRLAATQLPSASCVVTSHGEDFHLTDKASSRTHDPRNKSGDDEEQYDERRVSPRRSSTTALLQTPQPSSPHSLRRSTARLLWLCIPWILATSATSARMTRRQRRRQGRGYSAAASTAGCAGCGGSSGAAMACSSRCSICSSLASSSTFRPNTSLT